MNYSGATSPVHIDLGRGFARGQGNDRLVGIRSAAGSYHDDVIIGDEHANRIFGLIPWFDVSVYDPPTQAPTPSGPRAATTTCSPSATAPRLGDRTARTHFIRPGRMAGYGNDALFGVTDDPLDDTLIGGPGIDSAEDIYTTDHDTCIAETTTGCEVIGRSGP